MVVSGTFVVSGTGLGSGDSLRLHEDSGRGLGLLSGRDGDGDNLVNPVNFHGALVVGSHGTSHSQHGAGRSEEDGRLHLELCWSVGVERESGNLLVLL